jgi:hypothetical protein
MSDEKTEQRIHQIQEEIHKDEREIELLEREEEILLQQEHHEPESLDVVVTYPAAKEPYRENNVPRIETVANLKGRVLTAFGLDEGQHDGQTFTYTLYHQKRPLDNLSETLGEVAVHEHILELKLSQQITQG